MTTESHDSGPDRADVYEQSERVRVLIALLSEKDGMKRQGAREALVAIGEDAVAPLMGIVGGKKNPARWEAAKALAEIGSETSCDLLIECLEDDDSDISWLAAEGLINIGKPALYPLLVKLVDDPDSRRLRKGAHHVLHDLRHRDLHEKLTPILKTLESNVASEAMASAVQDGLKLLKKS